MSTNQEDLDLLLSLDDDKVLETLPVYPSAYLSDHGSPRQQLCNSDMSIFKDSMKDYLETEPPVAKKASPKLNRSKTSNDGDVEKFLGLRIKNLLVSPEELSNHLSDIRFVRLPTIRNFIVGDSIAVSWATIGVLSEKGAPKSSSNGTYYSGQILKLGTSVDFGVCNGQRKDEVACTMAIDKELALSILCTTHTLIELIFPRIKRYT
ncbi:hypothetical protein MKX03_015230 [Papaver bracteatum]|nr:hypothetical protein MKX03_015230 [Papaver bracteatum]